MYRNLLYIIKHFFKQRTQLKEYHRWTYRDSVELILLFTIQLCIGGSCYAQKHNGIAISLETWLGRLKHRINIISRVTTYIHLHIHDLGLKSSSNNKCYDSIETKTLNFYVSFYKLLWNVSLLSLIDIRFSLNILFKDIASQFFTQRTQFAISILIDNANNVTQAKHILFC